mmetsp:Transcript_15518/g.60696  ORF Transcript_15518/g.60696 Transcript_15518/m.60696 type:complete len:469 (+) Transcript_15518:162-1568(+)
MGARHRERRRVPRLCLGLSAAVVLAVVLLLLAAAGPAPPSAPLSAGALAEASAKATAEHLQRRPPVAQVEAGAMLARIRAIARMREEFVWPENAALYASERARCRKLSQHHMLLDEACTAVWLVELRNGEISGVHEMWGFEETHYGAITLLLENGDRALFKPCSTKSEDTTKEVIASALDQALGLGQTAPVITRRIALADIRRHLHSAEDVAKYNETVELCATEDGHLEGPVIGWWNDLTPVRTVRKYKAPLEDMPQIRAELGESLYTTQMQSRYHAFYWLINILRHGKDEFVTPQGDLVSLDLDRSRFTSTKRPNSLALNFTWCYTCYFDEEIVASFRAVGPTALPHQRLGAVMNESLHDEVFGNLWDFRLGQALDDRVAYYLDCVDSCVQAYGADQVLLNYATQLSGADLVQWYVLHSEYKDMNGKRGPDWFDWREAADQRKAEEAAERRARKQEKNQAKKDDFWA